MIYKYLTHPLYCHMTLTEGDFCSSKDRVLALLETFLTKIQ